MTPSVTCLVRSGHVSSCKSVPKPLNRTEEVTTTTLWLRTRANTNAGLGTVDEVRLASRQEHDA
jgi:hypothetical protein